MNRSTLLSPLFAIVALATASAADTPSATDAPAFAANARIGRGMNLGNALDAPSEGAWGVTLKAEYFGAIRRAGFDSIRLPVRWDTHAAKVAPFTIEPAYFARVDWALDRATAAGLAVVLNVHHDGSVNEDPVAQLPRIEAFWRQIAARYKDRPATVVFELLNEPHDKLTEATWDAGFPRLLAAVRATNPDRAVIVGPGRWNGIDALETLHLPEGDRMLIATVHDYNPFHFTHQGADWVEGSKAWKGTTWTGTPDERKAMDRDLDKAAAWGKAHRRPIFLGEFGAYSGAELSSRSRWTEAMARGIEARGMSWAYWEFASGFGAYDPKDNVWRGQILDALVPPTPSGIRTDDPIRRELKKDEPPR